MAEPSAWRRALPLLDVVVAIALVAWVVGESLARGDAPHPAVRAALGALTVAAVAVRRWRPTVAALVVAVAMTAESLTTEAPDETAVLLACVLVSWSVGAHAPRRESLPGIALVSLGVSVAIATDPSDSVANILPTLLLFVAVPFGAGLALRRRQQELAALTLEAQALALEADAAVEAERRRIARELHDVVSHAVTLIAVQAEAGAASIDTDPDQARRSLDAIGRVSREALAELHRLLGLLDGAEDDTEGGLERLPALVAGVRAAGLAVEVVESGNPRPLSSATDHCAFRVLQEGLTNALRHAPSSQVEVRVAYDTDDLRLGVDSHGAGHASAYGGTGRGLVGLRERVLGLGGTLVTDASRPGTFSLCATLPTGPA